MSVGFKYSGIWKEFGDGDLLHAFFSTVSYHLEYNSWGSKYPYLMKKLYYKKLEAEETLKALDELQDIRIKLATYNLEDIIWDVEDLNKKAPTSFQMQGNGKNLSECFISVSGKNIFDLLSEVLEFCKRRGISVQIMSERDLVK